MSTQSNNYEVVLVNTLPLLRRCISALKPASVIAADLEGIQLGRHGTVSLITIMDCSPPPGYKRPRRKRGKRLADTAVVQSPLPKERIVWIIDVQVLKNLSFDSLWEDASISGILENVSVTKLFFDVRSDSDALWHLHNVRLQGVYDVQLLEMALRISTQDLVHPTPLPPRRSQDLENSKSNDNDNKKIEKIHKDDTESDEENGNVNDGDNGDDDPVAPHLVAAIPTSPSPALTPSSNLSPSIAPPRFQVSNASIAGLSTCIPYYLTPPANWLAVKEEGQKLFNPAKGGSYDLFTTRPIDPRALAYSAQDVTLLADLKAELWKRMPASGMGGSKESWDVLVIKESTSRAVEAQRRVPKKRPRVMAPYSFLSRDTVYVEKARIKTLEMRQAAQEQKEEARAAQKGGQAGSLTFPVSRES